MVRKHLIYLCLFSGVLLWARCGFSQQPRSSDVEKPFTIIEIPGNYDDFTIPARQTQWIAENKKKMNVAVVIHTGDLTKDNTEQEWTRVDEALKRLDGVVPYLVAAGNHDSFPGQGLPRNRDTTVFNKHLPLSRFQSSPLFGGHYQQGSENVYYLLDAGGLRFMILNLEFAPREEVLDWANRVTAEHRDRRTLIVTHAYTWSGESRFNFMWHPLHVNPDNSDTAEIWDRYVRRHDNVFLILSGHYLGQRREISLGDGGNKLHHVLANYLQEGEKTQGWLRVIRFVPQQNKIEVRTYSPLQDASLTDEQNQFELEYRMN